MASSPVASLILKSILRHSKILSPSILRPYPRLPRTLQPVARRFAHSIPRPPNHPKTPSEQVRARKLSEPHYQLTFTCVPCDTRSEHIVSKIGYHHGSVLISCPGCRNRHIISDHLNIFGDRKITVEDLMREKGQLVKRGALGEHGDVEFWEDAAEFADKPLSDGVQGEDAGAVPETEAAISRETRDPSSQSTDPKPTASASLGDAGSRPSIGGSQPTNPTPSTRRQYSTKPHEETDKPSVSGGDFRIAAGDSDLHEGLYQLSQHLRADSKNRILQKEYRRVLSARHSALNRVPKEEMLSKVNQVYAERYGGEANADSEAPRQKPERRAFALKSLHKYIMAQPLVRQVYVQDRYDGVRLYDFPTVDGRPQYIRTGLGHLKHRRRPEAWTGEPEEEQEPDAEETGQAALDIPDEYNMSMPDDVPDGSDRTVYPTTARSWPQPKKRQLLLVQDDGRDKEKKNHFYETVAIRRAVRRSKQENTLVPINSSPRKKGKRKR